MWRYTPRYRDAETARKELRRDALFFFVIFITSIALVIGGMFSTKAFLIIRLNEALMLLVVLPVSGIALFLSWMRWRRFR